MYAVFNLILTGGVVGLISLLTARLNNLADRVKDLEEKEQGK